MFSAYDKDYEGTKGTAGTVQIAGWKVTKDSITIGEFGVNGFHMYPNGHKTDDASSKTYFGQSTDETWALGIGKNFGVTKEGELYCYSGEIAGWSL
jgi:hypothetical protein